jgi:hypothetical protein
MKLERIRLALILHKPGGLAMFGQRRGQDELEKAIDLGSNSFREYSCNFVVFRRSVLKTVATKRRKKCEATRNVQNDPVPKK